MKVFIILTILLIASAQDAPLYDDKSDVVHLTQSNFDSLVTNTNDMWLIEFYGTAPAGNRDSPVVRPLQSFCGRVQENRKSVARHRQGWRRRYD